MECVEKLIRKDMIHPLTDRKLKEKDIIPLQRVREDGLIKSLALYIICNFPSLSSYQGGTGYAITNDNLQAKEKRPMLQV